MRRSAHACMRVLAHMQALVCPGHLDLMMHTVRCGAKHMIWQATMIGGM